MMERVPALIVVTPSYVLAPESVRAPAPALVKPTFAPPLTIPPNVAPLFTVMLLVAAPSATLLVKVKAPLLVTSPSVKSPPIVMPPAYFPVRSRAVVALERIIPPLIVRAPPAPIALTPPTATVPALSVKPPV